MSIYKFGLPNIGSTYTCKFHTKCKISEELAQGLFSSFENVSRANFCICASFSDHSDHCGATLRLFMRKGKLRPGQLLPPEIFFLLGFRMKIAVFRMEGILPR